MTENSVNRACELEGKGRFDEARAPLFANTTTEERARHTAAMIELAASMRPVEKQLAKVGASMRPLRKKMAKIAVSMRPLGKQMAELRPALNRLLADVNEMHAKHKPPNGFFDDYAVAAENPKIDPVVRRAWQALLAADLPLGYHLAIATALPQPFRTRGRPRGHRVEIAGAVADIRHRVAAGVSMKDALTMHLNEFGTGNATRPARRRTLMKALAEGAK